MQSLFARFCGNEYPITATFMPYTRFNIRKCFLLWNYFPSDSDETEKYGIRFGIPLLIYTVCFRKRKGSGRNQSLFT